VELRSGADEDIEDILIIRDIDENSPFSHFCISPSSFKHLTHASVRQYATSIGIENLDDKTVLDLEKMAVRMSKDYKQEVKFGCSDEYKPIGFFIVPILAEMFARIYSETSSTVPSDLSKPTKFSYRNAIKFN
jgi:hypothetical protein